MSDAIIRLESGNRAEVWRFWFYKERWTLVLTEYRIEVRSTPRHKWKTNGWYDRLGTRDCSIKNEKDVPLPEIVQEMALKLVISKLRVMKWAEVSSD
jgi:hypothetical protein